MTIFDQNIAFHLIETHPLAFLLKDTKPSFESVLPWKKGDLLVAPANFLEPEVRSVPQIIRPKMTGCISGISTNLARYLLRADACHLARAYEILADLGHLGTTMLRKDFINTLSEYMGKEAARAAFDILSGKTAHRHKTDKKYKRSKYGDREKLSEFMVKIMYSNNNYKIQCTNFTKNSNASRRGRNGEGRPSKVAYIPTEGEMVQILLAIHILGISTDIDWDSFAPKPMLVMANQTSYKAFIMSIQVFEKGKGDYARKWLAGPVGIHINSVRKYAQRMGITVTTNEPELTPIPERHVQYLPKDKEERDRWIKLGNLPEGVHIQNKLKKKFEYTKVGALAAIASSRDRGGSGQIFKACYVASTYDPETCEYYSGNKEKLVEPESISVCDERYAIPKNADIVGYNEEIIPTSR